MNTKVPYKTPSHRNKYGLYVSYNLFSLPQLTKEEFIAPASIKISLVWFNSLGWYYTFNVEAFRWNAGKLNMLLKGGSSIKNSWWSKGPQVTECAKAAEEHVRSACFDLGFKPPEFAPYVLARDQVVF